MRRIFSKKYSKYFKNKKKTEIILNKKIIKDDLRLIEGVGPKIQSLLERKNINDFKTLSNTKVSKLEEILKEAGDRYAFHNPITWPEQALLAKEGKWGELEEFQNFLKGGKNV